MRLLVLILSLYAGEAMAAKRLSNKYPQYLPVFGIGSTSSVAYGASPGTSFSMIAPNGEANALVRIVTTSAALVAVGASPTAAASDMLVPANTPIELEIPSTYKVSATPLSAAGTLYVTHLVTYPNND